jgi:DNA-binding LytR/AlgR family response regulator
MKVIIIEDEQPALKRLQRLIETIRPQAKICAHADSVEDAVEVISMHQDADLIFMDIQLADGLSFDIFTKMEVRPPVIFTTAFDHYALKAFKVNSIEYLLKPIEEQELIDAFAKFDKLQKQSQAIDYSEILKAIREKKDEYKQRFLIKTAGRLTFVNIQDIAYFFSDEGNSFLVTINNDRFLLESILEEVESSLDPSAFFRINRKMIVSLGSIKRIDPHFNNRYALVLQPEFEEETIVSRQRSAEFRAWLDK